MSLTITRAIYLVLKMLLNDDSRISNKVVDVLQNDNLRNATLGCNGSITMKRRSNHVQRCEDKI